MNFNYPPVPDHPEVLTLNQEHFKMSREEYQVLFDVVQRTGAKKILEFGAGDGISAAVMLLASPQGTVTSIDPNPSEITRRAIPTELLNRHIYGIGTSQEFAIGEESQWDLILVDGHHEHEFVSKDINWAGDHAKVVVAHDIIQFQTEHIDQICKDLVARNGKDYSRVLIGHGLGIIS